MDDVELLKRFVATGDESAFRAIVECHAGMVHAACRRGLGGDAALADDATQAVFLILAQKARTIRDAHALSGWLFRTAHAVVVNMKLSESRRRRREAVAAAEREKELAMATPNEKWEQARPHLNEALASLRPKQQAAVVLRFLEGRPQAEVARLLGCSEGAVKERVAYALEKLRAFFTRRGVSFSTVTLAALLTGEAAPAATMHLVSSCISTIAGTCAAGTSVALPAAKIAKGTLQMIFWAKVKTAAAVVLAVTIATAGTAAAVSLRSETPLPRQEPRAEAGKPEPAATGRTWHVSPRKLTGLPEDSQRTTISEAAKSVQPGDTVIIHDGIYRETVVVVTSGTAEKPIRFQAALGENVMITGADEIKEWKKEADEENVYSTPWPHRFIGWTKEGTHPGDDYHKMIGRCEQVFVLNYPLLQVLERRKLTRGTFHVDLEAKRLFICPRDNADMAKNPPLVEASSRGLLWHSKGAYIHLRGLRFRYAANMAQHGATLFEGNNGVIEDCVLEKMNSSGATLTAENLVFRRCIFQENGQLGFGANRAHNLLLTECIVRNNNVKGWNRGWEAGGDKLCFCRGAVLEKTQFVNNRGNGVWFDIGNEKCEVRNCLIADNEDAGIFYEISYSLYAHDNVIVGNGFNETPGSWGAASGISLSSSPECVIERNLLVGNREGFNFREQNRTTPLIDDKKERWVWNHDQVIRNNVMAYNRDAQTWGWFDIADGRHWPVAMQEPGEKEKGKATQDLAAEYNAKDNAGAPVGLSLEKLKITFEGNLYCAQPWQGLFNWGVSWKRHKKYAKLEDVQSELKLEKGSQALPFTFEDYLTRDFRVPADSPALRMGCYPKGEVPGVKLGTK